MDEDFLLSLQTHMQRLTRSVEQDTKIIVDMAGLSASKPELLPLYLHMFSVTANQLEAISDITKDIAVFTKWGIDVINLLSASSVLPPPPVNTTF